MLMAAFALYWGGEVFLIRLANYRKEAWLPGGNLLQPHGRRI